MKKVNNSNLPAIINSESIAFEKSEKMEKFILGPTRLKPGPTFPTQVNTEEIVVIKSNPLSDMTVAPANTTKIYRKIKFAILVATSCGTARFPTVTVINLFGCSFRETPRLTIFSATRIRINFTPPPVEEEQAPVSIRMKINIFANVGQMS